MLLQVNKRTPIPPLDATVPIVFDENRSGMNTPEDVLAEHVKHNIRLGYPQIKQFADNPDVALLVCGGPSLASTERELIEEYWKGGKIVAVNGTVEWCLERNLKPSAVIMLDAREFNARFVEKEIPNCRYLLASQCHPKTFETCQGRDIWIWHACASEKEEVILKEYYFEQFLVADIGVTVGIRALTILRMLGFVWQDVYGLDSCWLDGEHHAYAQDENARDINNYVWLRPKGRDDLAKCFVCSPWHIKQAYTFREFLQRRGDLVRLNIRGDGLIATMMRTGADLETGASNGR